MSVIKQALKLAKARSSTPGSKLTPRQADTVISIYIPVEDKKRGRFVREGFMVGQAAGLDGCFFHPFLVPS